MYPMGTPDISADLLRRIHETNRRKGDSVEQLVGLAIRSAIGPRVDDRAWALTELGALLRAMNRRQEALKALDAVMSMDAAHHVRIAAHTCAVAVHCDAEDYETARKVGESARRRWRSDAQLLRSLGRAYIGLYTETGWVLMQEEGERCFRQAEALAPTA